MDFNKGQVERQKEGGKLNDEMADSFTFSFMEHSFLFNGPMALELVWS